MRNIYTGIDIGSDNIKIVVAELIKEQFHVLARTSINSVGIKRGLIDNYDMALNSLKLAVKDIENTLGCKIKKVLVTVPSNNRELLIVDGKIEIDNDYITGDDINTVLTLSKYGTYKFLDDES